jgi:hypothetical protein
VLAAEGGFVSLAEIIRSRPITLRAALGAESLAAEPGAPAEQPAAPDPVRESTAQTSSSAALVALLGAQAASPETAAAARDARLFRAALADSFDVLAAKLIGALAADVLGRELQLGAVAIETIVRRLIAERSADEPLSVRLCPADAQIDCELPVVADPGLESGDAVLVCRNGEIDARLALRFAHVLAELTR